MASQLPKEEVEYQILHWNDNQAPVVSGISIAFFTAASVTVFLRLFARRITSVSLKQDDYLIILALIFALGLLIENLLGTRDSEDRMYLWLIGKLAVQYGLGKHLVRVGVDGLVQDLKVAFAYEITYIFCHLAIKLSVLFLYRRLFSTHQTCSFTIILYIVGAYVVAWAIYTFLVILFQCTPIHYSWDLPRGFVQGQCIDLTGGYLGTGITNTVSDFAVLILPMPIVWSLKIRRRQKLIICGIFLLGSFACASSIARVIFLVRSTNGPVDTTYDTVQPIIWSIIEPTLGIICACLPILRPLFQSFISQIALLSHSVSQAMSSRRPPSSTPAASLVQEEKQNWSSPTPSSDMNSTTTDGWQSGGRGGGNARRQPSSSTINDAGFEFLRPNRLTLSEQIRRSHGSWLIPEKEEEVLAQVYHYHRQQQQQQQPLGRGEFDFGWEDDGDEMGRWV
ncbi:MAG: hypothetical protein Q9190_000155 [Brigantiaea leucoxantha]